MRQLLLAFRDAVDDMTLEQKRTAVRTLVRKVVWDGEYAHAVLFGAEDPFECPDLADRFAPEEKGDDLPKNEQNDDEMVESESCLGKILPPSAHKTRWGEDSICYSLSDALKTAYVGGNYLKFNSWRLLVEFQTMSTFWREPTEKWLSMRR